MPAPPVTDPTVLTVLTALGVDTSKIPAIQCRQALAAAETRRWLTFLGPGEAYLPKNASWRIRVDEETLELPRDTALYVVAALALAPRVDGRVDLSADHPPPPDPRWTPTQAAERISQFLPEGQTISERTVRELIRTEQIRAVRVGRFYEVPESAIREYISAEWARQLEETRV